MTALAAADPVPVSLKLLLIEDSVLDATLFKRLLAIEFESVDCLQIATLAEATPAVVAAADAVILDLNLPDATPETTIEWIRTCPKPVVVHSGNTDRGTVDAVAEAGALNYVCKGSSVQQMVVGVEFAMAEHRRAQQRRDRRQSHIRELLEKLEIARRDSTEEIKDGSLSSAR